MRILKEKWSKKCWGIQLGTGPSNVLTNVRFADDVLLVGLSLHQAREMLSDLIVEPPKI